MRPPLHPSYLHDAINARGRREVTRANARIDTRVNRWLDGWLLSPEPSPPDAAFVEAMQHDHALRRNERNSWAYQRNEPRAVDILARAVGVGLAFETRAQFRDTYRRIRVEAGSADSP